MRRDKPDLSARPQPGVVANERVDLAEQELGVSVEELAQIIIEGIREVPIGREMLELLQAGLPSLTQRQYSADAVIAGQTAARLGFLAREAELAMFDGDLGTDDDLVATLGDALDTADGDGTSSWDALAQLAATMAIAESLDPSPAEGGPSWTLPGLDGHFRAGLCDDLTLRLTRPPDVTVDDLKRTWKYGYFLRVLDELCDE